MSSAASTTVNATAIRSLDQLYDVLADLDYEPLWTIEGALTPEPATRMQPHLWRYDEVRSLIVRAGDLISAEAAERRVLAFRNPGTAAHELPRTTDTLWAAIQLVRPGELAPPHRHTPAALRYIIEGEGAYTVVDGVRCELEPGDFVLTPNWSWHEHGHNGSEPVIWLDGLDLPMVHTMRLVFAEFQGAPEGSRQLAPAALRTGTLRPAWAGGDSIPPIVYKRADVEGALQGLRDQEGSPFDDLILEYRDPVTDGPALPTISAYMQLLRPGVQTRPHRHTASTVYHVVAGTGRSVVGDEQLGWSKGDTFAVPTWAEHQHTNPSSEDALLFSFSDAPTLRALGLYREEPVA